MLEAFSRKLRNAVIFREFSYSLIVMKMNSKTATIREEWDFREMVANDGFPFFSIAVMLLTDFIMEQTCCFVAIFCSLFHTSVHTYTYVHCRTCTV